MRARALPAFGISAALLSLTACASGGTPPPRGAEAEALFAAFSTVWVLNGNESDTFQQAMESSGASAAGRGGAAAAPAGGGGRGGGGGRRRDPSAGMGDATRTTPRGTMRGVPELGRMAGTRLSLSVSESAIHILPEGAMGLELVPGQAVVRTLGELELEISAQWKGRNFEVERDVKDGATLTETYRVSESGDHLYIDRVIRTGGGPVISFTQVYDRAN